MTLYYPNSMNIPLYTDNQQRKSCSTLPTSIYLYSVAQTLTLPSQVKSQTQFSFLLSLSPLNTKTTLSTFTQIPDSQTQFQTQILSLSLTHTFVEAKEKNNNIKKSYPNEQCESSCRSNKPSLLVIETQKKKSSLF